MNHSDVATFFRDNSALFMFGTEPIVENTCSLSGEVGRNARATWIRHFNWGNMLIDECQNRSVW